MRGFVTFFGGVKYKEMGEGFFSSAKRAGAVVEIGKKQRPRKIVPIYGPHFRN